VRAHLLEGVTKPSLQSALPGKATWRFVPRADSGVLVSAVRNDTCSSRMTRRSLYQRWSSHEDELLDSLLKQQLPVRIVAH
jgi:hypothetical protein